MCRSLVILTFSLQLLPSIARASEPYQLVAVYKTKALPTDEVSVVVADTKTYPVTTSDLQLGHFAIKFPSEGLLAGDRFAIEHISFDRWQNGVKAGREEWTKSQIEGKEVTAGATTLFDYAELHGPSPIDILELAIRVKYTASYLCTQETALRADIGEPMTKEGKFNRASMPFLEHITSNKGTTAASQLADTMRGMLYSGPGPKTKWPILYSFCPNISSQINWQHVAQAAAQYPDLLRGRSNIGQDNLNPRELAATHKTALVRLLVERLPSLGFGVQPTVVEISDQEGTYTLLELTGYVRVALVKDIAGLLQFQERSAKWGRRKLEGNVDQSSTIALTTRDTSNAQDVWNRLGGYQNFFDLLQIEMETTDDKGNVIPKSPSLDIRQPTDAALKVSLTEFLDKTATIKVYTKVGSKKSLVMASDEFTVKSLGWITTFPGVSEIATLVNHYNAKDPQATSTVPVSWAVNLSTHPATVSNIAISLPWMISYNTRSNPDFAKYFSGFIHISLILEKQGNGNGLVFGTGVGVSLLQILQLSWAVTHSGEEYLMVGLSVPSLAKLAW
jgi:hypothetical protein